MTFRTIRNTGLGILLVILSVVGLVPTLILVTISDHNTALLQEMEALKEVFSLNEELRDALFYFDENIRIFQTDFSLVIRKLEKLIEATQRQKKKLQENREHPEELEKARALVREIRLFKLAIYNYGMEVAYDPTSDTAYQLERLVQETKKKTAIIFFDQNIHKKPVFINTNR